MQTQACAGISPGKWLPSALSTNCLCWEGGAPGASAAPRVSCQGLTVCWVLHSLCPPPVCFLVDICTVSVSTGFSHWCVTCSHPAHHPMREVCGALQAHRPSCSSFLVITGAVKFGPLRPQHRLPVLYNPVGPGGGGGGTTGPQAARAGRQESSDTQVPLCAVQ